MENLPATIEVEVPAKKKRGRKPVSFLPLQPQGGIKTLQQLEVYIKKMLAISFLTESGMLRNGSPTLPIEEAERIYRSTPTVFFFINKQVYHCMKGINEFLKNQKAGETKVSSDNSKDGN